MIPRGTAIASISLLVEGIGSMNIMLVAGVKEGAFADVAIFDEDRVIDRATFENPHQCPVGIEYVIVNGEVTIDKGQHTGALAGRVIYGSEKRRAD